MRCLGEFCIRPQNAVQIDLFSDYAVCAMELREGARHAEGKIGKRSGAVFQNDVPFEVRKYAFGIGIVVFAAGALTEPVHILLGVRAREVSGVDSKVTLQLYFSQERTLFWWNQGF